MPKKKIPFNGHVHTTRFVNYDDDGNVLSMTGIKEGKNSFEIDINLVNDFLIFKKDPTKYKISYFINLSKGIISTEENLIEINNTFYILNISSNLNNEINLEHNKKYWSLSVRKDILDVNLNTNITFYISKKDNPNFFLKELTFNLKKNKHIKFTTIFEEDLKNLIILTERKFNSYGIRDLA